MNKILKKLLGLQEDSDITPQMQKDAEERLKKRKAAPMVGEKTGLDTKGFTRDEVNKMMKGK